MMVVAVVSVGDLSVTLICPRVAWLMFKPRLTSVISKLSVTLKVLLTPLPLAQPASGMLVGVVFSYKGTTFQV